MQFPSSVDLIPECSLNVNDTATLHLHTHVLSLYINTDAGVSGVRLQFRRVCSRQWVSHLPWLRGSMSFGHI